MTVPEIINELLSIQASALVLAERAGKLILKLEPAPPGRSRKKSSLTEEEINRVLTKRKKTRLKQLQKGKDPL